MSIRFECYCLKLETKNGKVFGFVSLDIPVTIEGLEYSPIGGVDSTASNQTSGLEIDNIQLELLIDDNNPITPRYIRSQALSGAKATLAIVDFTLLPATLTDGHVVFTGDVAETKLTNTTITLEILAATQTLNKDININVAATCRFELGDNRCQYDLIAGGRQVDTTILAIEVIEGLGYNFTVGAGVSFDEHWINGKATFLDGDNVGLPLQIVSVDGANPIFRIEQELPENPVIGDSVRLQAGCRKDIETCEVIYNNRLRFGGGIVGGNNFASIHSLEESFELPSYLTI